MNQLSQAYPISVVCGVLAVSRSSLYYKPVERESVDGLKTTIARLAGEHPTYGYRRITAMLHRSGQTINHK